MSANRVQIERSQADRQGVAQKRVDTHRAPLPWRRGRSEERGYPKYLTADHLWYSPPADAFERLSEYANRHGDPRGAPYYSADGRSPIRRDEWDSMRAKFHCEYGVTNVWREPPVNGGERLKADGRVVHINQKPLRLLEICIRASSDEGDVVWEPFGGLCSVAVAAHRLGRQWYGAEISDKFYAAARRRLQREVATKPWPDLL